jgi:tRNA(fMet)-specific endonuclease VapC
MLFLDSDILIYSLKGLLKLDIKYEYLISPIVYSEVLYGFIYAKRSKAELEDYLMDRLISVGEFSKATSDIFTHIKYDLYQKGRCLADNDVLIASSAIEYDMPLWTNNKKHFQRIPKLQLIF